MNPFQAILQWLQQTWQNSVNSIKNGGFMKGDPVVLYAQPPVPILPYNEFLTPQERGDYPTQPYSTLNRPSVQRPSILSRLVGSHPLLPSASDIGYYAGPTTESTGAKVIKPTFVPATYESLAHLHKRGYNFPYSIDAGARRYLKRLQHRPFNRRGLVHAKGHGPAHNTSQSEPQPQAKAAPQKHAKGHGYVDRRT
jgi:hypothetical protein